MQPTSLAQSLLYEMQHLARVLSDRGGRRLRPHKPHFHKRPASEIRRREFAKARAAS